MSHHGSIPPEFGETGPRNKELSEAMRKLMGEFPAGKLNKDDAGAIAMAVGVENHRVVIRFPKPVAWIGMTGDEAFELAQSLLRHARHAGVTAPLVITLGGASEERSTVKASLDKP